MNIFRHFTLILFTALSIFTGISQTVLISDDINVRPDDIYQIIGEADDYIFFFHERSNEVEIMIFDTNLKFIRSHVMVLEKKGIVPFGINMLDDEINFIYFFRDRGQVVMSLRKFNTQMEIVAKDTIFITDRSDFTPRFNMVECEDQSKVMIYTIERNSLIRVFAYDLRHNVNLWNQSVNVEGSLRNDFKHALMSNDGSGYFFLDRSPESFKKQRLNLEIIRFNPLVDQPTSINLEVTDLNGEESFITYDNLNDFIVVTGMYSEKANNRLNGVFVLRMNADNPDLRVFNKYPYSTQLEQKIIAESRDRQEGVLDLKPVDVVIREDGGILMLSEVQREHQRYGGVTADRTRSSRTWTDYYNEDIVMNSFHPDGEEHWNLVLHKKQYSQDDAAAYSSFFIFKNRNALRLFFNDEISHNNTVSEYIIDGTGKSLRKSVMSTEYQKLRLRFQEAIQLDGRSFIVPSDSGNRMNLVKVTYG